jgi:hypothetical protein
MDSFHANIDFVHAAFPAIEDPCCRKDRSRHPARANIRKLALDFFLGENPFIDRNEIFARDGNVLTAHWPPIMKVPSLAFHLLLSPTS